VSHERYDEPEPFYALRAYVCATCYLVQLATLVAPQAIFSDYAYFSSYAESWVQHAKRYSREAGDRFALGGRSFVVELGSNDGYLLQHFVARDIPVLGIDPAANIAAVARQKGVPTLTRFFGVVLARELVASGPQADLIVANNVLAQVPDLHDFIAGVTILLARRGVVTVEVPHLWRLMEENQFDTIYHEHFSYFSFLSAQQIFAQHDLRCFDVDELPTHGGSLRIYARHTDNTALAVTDRVGALRERERALGYVDRSAHLRFDEQVKETKRAVLTFLIDAKRRGKRVVGYGAAGKGMTMLNYCGIGTDFVDFVVDRNPYKQGRFCPGSHIPVLPVDALWEARPDYVLILPWNLRDEISAQLAGIRDWGGQFVVPIPTTEVW
jgi:hypothetical protein